MSAIDEFVIKPWMHSCLYFCSDFFEAYKHNRPIKDVNAHYLKKEAIFSCRTWLQILNFYTKDFGEIKKVLIQYFVPVGDCNRIVTAKVEFFIPDGYPTSDEEQFDSEDYKCLINCAIF